MKTMLKVLALFCVASSALALSPGDKVDNFRLLDANGKSHELYYLSDMKAVVLMVQGNGCPIVRQAVPAYRDIRNQYRDRGVEFLLINSNLQDNANSIAQEAKEFAFDIPVLVDGTQLIGESLGFNRTGEILVIDAKTWKLAYRGPIDDRLSYEKQRLVAQHQYLRDALDAVLAGQPVKESQVNSAGCIINMPEQERRATHEKISYSKTIAPMLVEKCTACDQQGGVAPWAMTSYDVVKGFAPMIREVVRTKRMPPWHADPHYGSFVGDRSLTEAQTKTLVHWIEAGAPRGVGSDPLAAVKPDTEEWKLGPPDAIVEIPAYTVPATGIIEYQCPEVKNPIGHDAWIRGLEVHVGNKSIVHHIIVNNPSDVQPGERKLSEGGGGRRFCNAPGNLGGFAPGLQPVVFPKDTGVFFPKDSNFVFQVHYTASGKVATDHSRVGLYFLKEPPKYPLHMNVMGDNRFAIPPGAKDYTVTQEREIKRDMIVYDIMPHAHLRGKASRMTAIFPDGRTQILLNVPRYDFNWQTGYILKEPILIPKGSKLVWDMTWDNSKQNPANPDPTQTVRWGDQTFEEMGLGFFRYRWVDEEVGKEKEKKAATETVPERTAAATH
ncbi:MAG TPA: redoxin family protein [Steroidobacteraceae bacterium]|nr:redoxin family protein [Steroidobacteraceae bacterium]